MSIAPTERIFTFEEYLNYEDGTENRYELEDGILIKMPPASDLHEAIITFLLIRFYQQIDHLKLNWRVRPSGTGVRTENKKSRLPDLLVMTQEQRQSIKTKSAVLEQAPELVVEVVSEESRKRDYEKKPKEYAKQSIPEYWIVDPIENKITICSLNNKFYSQKVFVGQEQVVSQIFPELNLTVETILKAD